MNRAKKIELRKNIRKELYLYVIRRGWWDYYWDEEPFYKIAFKLGCPKHVVKGYFFKEMLPEDEKWFEIFR